MTRAQDIEITIGGIALRVGDLCAWSNNYVILKNGMRINASEFEIARAKKHVNAALGEAVKSFRKNLTRPEMDV